MQIAKRAYVIDDYIASSQNGIGVYVKELSRCLIAIGYAVNFITFNSKYSDFTLKKYGVIHYLYFPQFLYNPVLTSEKHKVISRLLRLHIEDNANNVFFFNYSPANTLMEIIKKYYPYSKLVYTIHDLAWSGTLLGNEHRMKQLIRKRKKSRKDQEKLSEWQLQLQTMDIADAIICLSEDTLHFIKETSPQLSAKTHLIPNALKIDKRIAPIATKQELRNQYGIPPKEIILLFVGRMTEAKGITPLLKALSALRENQNIRVAIAGSAALIDLNSFTEVMPNIIYLGYIDKEKLHQWYKIADIGIITSYTEQCSYAGLEMMSHNLPVIASDGFGVRCMFMNEINAVTAYIGNRTSDNEYVHNIINAVTRLANNDELKVQLAQNAQCILKQRYSILTMKTNYKCLLSSL